MDWENNICFLHRSEEANTGVLSGTLIVLGATAHVHSSPGVSPTTVILYELNFSNQLERSKACVKKIANPFEHLYWWDTREIYAPCVGKHIFTKGG